MLRLLCLVVAFGWASNALSTKNERSLSLFNLVKFDNDMCTGDKRNGTCYTKDECESRDGKESGTCAEGFGVCCILELKCGKSSSENNTYLVETSPTAGEGCTYEICPQASSICRIRYDFTEHTLKSPTLITSRWGTTTNVATDYAAGAGGHCTSDTFSIINSGAASSPIICGTNKGQHMILDSDGKGCQKAVFQLSSETFTRKWEVHVTQFSCNDLEMTTGGPKGCLQYFNSDSGDFRSFNFRSATDVGTNGLLAETDTHLVNQNYKVCIKKNPSKTKLCMTPIGKYSEMNGQKGTYGVSGETTMDAAATGVTDSKCVTDWLAIPGGASLNTAITTANKADVFKICGRFIGSNAATAADSVTVCTFKQPFVVQVNFDGSEAVDTIAVDMLTMANMANERFGSGSVGFLLQFAQT